MDDVRQRQFFIANRDSNMTSNEFRKAMRIQRWTLALIIGLYLVALSCSKFVDSQKDELREEYRKEIERMEDKVELIDRRYQDKLDSLQHKIDSLSHEHN